MFWIISTVIFLVSLVCTIVFRAIASNNDSYLAGVLAYLSALAGGVGNIIYLCNQDIYRVWHVLLGIAFAVIPMLILLVMAEDEVGCLTYIVTMVLLIAAIVFIGSTAWENYHSAFVEQPGIVECESYELVAASYDSDINGTLTTKYYRRVEGEVREDDLFKFYYLADSESGEMKLMTLNASEVSLYFVEEGEKPCWKVITTTQIRVNSKTGKVEEEVCVRNELYVPSESITPGYDLDVVD